MPTIWTIRRRRTEYILSPQFAWWYLNSIEPISAKISTCQSSFHQQFRQRVIIWRMARVVTFSNLLMFSQERYQRNVSSEFVNAIWVTTSAIFPLGGLFGSFLIGPLITRFGRLVSSRIDDSWPLRAMIARWLKCLLGKYSYWPTGITIPSPIQNRSNCLSRVRCWTLRRAYDPESVASVHTFELR